MKRANPPSTPHLTFDDAEKSMAQFKNDVIYPTIAQNFDENSEEL